MANEEQPFDPDELLQLIARLAAKRWLRKQSQKHAASSESDTPEGCAVTSEEAKQIG